MPIYKIIESRPTITYWHWTVEAENEEAALDKVMNGDAGEADEFFQSEDWNTESSYDVEEELGQDL